MPELQASERTRELEITQARLSKPMTSNGDILADLLAATAPSHSGNSTVEDCGHGNLQPPVEFQSVSAAWF